MLATSLPVPGSVIARAATFSPWSTGRTKLLPLSRGPVLDDGWQSDAVAPQPDHGAHGSARLDELLLNREDVGDIPPRPSDLHGVSHAGEARRCGCAIEPHGKLARFLPGVGVGRDFPLCKAPRLEPQGGVGLVFM